jgi:hypothetical protein
VIGTQVADAAPASLVGCRHQYLPHAVPVGALQYGLAIRIECGRVKMGMAVGEHAHTFTEPE